MDAITNAVNAVSSTVTNTIWGEKDPNENKLPTEQTTKPEHKDTFGATTSPGTFEDTAVRDSYPSLMGTTSPTTAPPTEQSHNPVPEISHLSMNEGHRDDSLDMSHGKVGYPYKDSKLTEDTITGSSTGNTAMANVLIDGGGSIDRDLEGHDPRIETERTEKKHNHGHRRYDSGVEGLETQDVPPSIAQNLYRAPVSSEGIANTGTEQDRPFQGSVTERSGSNQAEDSIGEDQKNKGHYVPKLSTFTETGDSKLERTGVSHNEDRHSNVNESTYSPAAFNPTAHQDTNLASPDIPHGQDQPVRHHDTSLPSSNLFHDTNENKSRMDDPSQDRSTEHHKVASSLQGNTQAPEQITPQATLGPQREGVSSSNEPTSQGDPPNPATTNAVHTMGKGFQPSAGGLGEPSVGVDVSSGAQPTDKQQGAGNPMDTPMDTLGGDTTKRMRHQSPSEGSGQLYEKSTGTAAEGGDFDAIRPGAGREADRLLEEAGVQRTAPGGKAGAQLNEGHKFGHLLHHHSSPNEKAQTAGSTETPEHSEKKSVTEKLKEKLHIGGRHHE